jgi:hypothetical protein
LKKLETVDNRRAKESNTTTIEEINYLNAPEAGTFIAGISVTGQVGVNFSGSGDLIILIH